MEIKIEKNTETLFYKREEQYFITIELFISILAFNILLWTNKILHKLFIKYNLKYALLPFDRRRYVIKNVNKSIWLFSMTFFAVYILVDALIYNYWNNGMIHIMGIVYGIPDTVALFIVPNLPLSTKVHHFVVTLLYIINVFQDVSQFHYWRAIIIYAIFSILSGSVNGYLGFRLVCPDSMQPYKNAFKRFAYYNYIICFVSIWVYQYYIIITWIYTKSMWEIGFVIYMILSHLIMYDDLVLIKFLRKPAS